MLLENSFLTSLLKAISKNSFQTVSVLSERKVEENFQIQHSEMGYIAKAIQISDVYNFLDVSVDYFPEVFLELKMK